MWLKVILEEKLDTIGEAIFIFGRIFFPTLFGWLIPEKSDGGCFTLQFLFNFL